MKLPEPKYFSREELAARWETSSDRVEHYLIEGMLKASIKLGPALLALCYTDENGNEKFKDVQVEKGLFTIRDYEKLVWVERPHIGLSSDFANQNERLIRNDLVYTFYKSYEDREANGYAPLHIKPSDIFISIDEVKRFELENAMTAINSDYKEPPALIEPGQPSSNNSLDVAAYLEQKRDAPLAEKVYFLRTNTSLTANKIGQLLNISHKTQGSNSRKVTVGNIFKKEAQRLGTWEQVKRKYGE